MAEIKHLVALGCSFTFGQYLDTTDNVGMGDPPRPGRHSWPNLVADHFQVRATNLAWPGGSCRLVAHRCIHHNWQQGDFAAILWPSMHRHWFLDVADKDHISNNWCPNSSNYTRWWKRGYSNDNDREASAYMMKTLVKLHLQNLGVPCIEFTYDWYTPKHREFETPWVPLMPSWFENKHRYYFPDLALDGDHPGEQGHRMIAEVYTNEIQRRLQ